jgi:hypothetical protein
MGGGEGRGTFSVFSKSSGADQVKDSEGDRKFSHRTWNPEKRRHARYCLDLPIEYMRRDLVVRHDRVIDASEGGLSALFSQQMEVGQSLRIKLFFPSHSAFNFIEMVTQVVWMDVQVREDWRDCRTGVRYLDISIEVLRDLKIFLASLSG